MPKKTAARFCGDCGYEFARDDTGECRMCARLEQLRDEATVLRPNERANQQALIAESIDADLVAPAEWPPTAAEYRAMLAARRRSTKGPRRRHVTSVIGTGLRPGDAAQEAPSPALEAPSAPLVADSVRTSPRQKPTTRRKRRPRSTSASEGPIQIALPQTADVSMEARTPLAAESPPPPGEAQAGRESRSMLPRPRADVPRFSAAVNEPAADASPSASRVLRAPAKGQPQTSEDQGYPWKTALWVAIGGGLLAASVALLAPMIR